MKRCLNCRKTYEEDLTECPYCGYKPRSKAVRKRIDDTQDFDISSSTKTAGNQKNKQKNSYTSSGHSGSFYLRNGERLNKRYSVLSVMGFGLFGVAYDCLDSYTQQNVVIKEYMPSYLVTRAQNGREVEPLSDEAEVTFSIGVDSFIDESNKLSTNDVECVPKMIECFKQNNTSYVVTELVHGEALSSIIRRKGKLSYHATITIITGVLQGLRQLNKVGIIHGDICPDNIIVTANGDTLLLDYNLSDFNKNVYTQRDSGKLRSGYSALEMYYMNMEQGPWTDVYAAAATMYKMLTGITVPSAIKRKTSDTLTSLSKLGVPITHSAEKAMFSALKVDYEKRTKNPEDFLNGLMGDGFDNLAVEKEAKSSHTQKMPSRPQQIKPENNIGNKILNRILVFLILAIIAVVIWLFISGVFTLPKSLTAFLGSGEDDNTDTSAVSRIEDDDNSQNDYVGEFYEDDEDSEDESGSIVDGILEGVTSFVEEQFSSQSEEEQNSNESENNNDDYNEYYNESYYDDNQSYYDDDESYNDFESYSPDVSYTESAEPEEDTDTSVTSESGGIIDSINSILNYFD